MTHSKRMAEAEIDAQVPVATSWSVDQCAQWLEDIGLPQYKECFLDNLITGRKLITLDMNSLPNIGITDYEHLKVISSGLHELLHQPADDYRRTISLPHRDPLGIYLEKRVRTGQKMDNQTYCNFLKSNAKLLTACYGRNPLDDFKGKKK